MATPVFRSIRRWLVREARGPSRTPARRARTVCMLDPGARHCGISSYLFEQARRTLEANGYRVTGEQGDADVILVNTCAATGRALAPVQRLVDDLIRRYPTRRIVVYGCLAAYSRELGRHANVSLIGPSESDRLSDLLTGEMTPADVAMDAPPVRMESIQDPQGQKPTDAHLLIAQGCIHSCTYCNVKLIKGNVRSRPIADLRRETARLVEQGEREILLLADDCGSYGRDLGTDFPTLVSELLAVDAGVRLKVYYLHPGLFLEYLPRLWKPLCEGRLTYLCVPLQSGSRRVLALMNRDYDPQEVAARLDDLRRASPGIYLFSHFIFNFPSEDLAEFERSLQLVPTFDAALVVEYSDNPRTRAARLTERCGERDLAAKTERLRRFVEERRARVESLAGDDVVNWRVQLPRPAP